MSGWCYNTDIFMLVILSTFQICTVEASFPYKQDNTCSSRPDNSCTRCNGIPECFDLSDESGCRNTTLKFISVQKATQECHDRNCLRTFPKPPPLPPFSLCKGRQQTTKYTTESITVIQITTKSTTDTVTSSPIITKPSTPSRTSSKPTDQSSPQTRRTTRKPITTTQPPLWPTTYWWDKTTSQWPVVVKTTTRPPWSTTQWIPTTTQATDRLFMKMWRSCAARHRYNRDIYACAVNCFLRCYNTKRYPSCLDGGSLIFDGVQPNTTPTTVENSLFNAVPTQFFPTFQPTTYPPTENPYTRVDQDYYNSNRITDQEMSYIYMLSRLLNN